MAGELRPGEPSDMMYVKFADQFLAKAQYDNALFYIEQALAMNPNCLVCRFNNFRRIYIRVFYFYIPGYLGF